jgi:hypothetical protein
MAKQVTVDRVTEARPYPFAKLSKRNKAAGGGPTAFYRCVARRLASSGGREPYLAIPWDARASVKRGALPFCRANDPR